MAMPYAPTTSPARIARPVVAMAPLVVNQRQSGREDPNWLGTIRGGYGNPVRELRVEEPIDRVVRRACADALTTRGLAAGGSRPRYTLSVTIHQFDANQYVRREATADFSAVLTEAATGREVWRDRERAYNVDGSLLSLDTGVFASTEDLRRVAVQTMNQAIDRLLDKPAFLAAVQR
jgi:hypothetical protein